MTEALAATVTRPQIRPRGWQRRLIDYGRSYAVHVKRDYKLFVRAQKERQ